MVWYGDDNAPGSRVSHGDQMAKQPKINVILVGDSNDDNNNDDDDDGKSTLL